jgi:hypothetical protein
VRLAFLRFARLSIGMIVSATTVTQMSNFGHEAVDSIPHIRQQYQNVRAVVAAGQRSLNGIHLSTNPFDAGNELLLFFIDVRYKCPSYTLGG